MGAWSCVLGLCFGMGCARWHGELCRGNWWRGLRCVQGAYGLEGSAGRIGSCLPRVPRARGGAVPPAVTFRCPFWAKIVGVAFGDCVARDWVVGCVWFVRFVL